MESQCRRRGGFGGLIEAVQYRKSAGILSCSSRSTTLSWTRGLPPDSCDLSYVSLTPWTPCEGYDSFSRLTLYHHFALFRTNESQRHQSQAIPLLPTYRAAPPYPHEMSPQRHWSLSGTHTNPRTQRNPVLFLLDSFTLILERPRRR